MERLSEKLKRYCREDNYPMHMPGHKRRTCLTPGYETDITEIPGFDNLHHPEDLLKDSQMNAAKIYGTLDSFYLVSGSTVGILAAIHAVVKPGARVAVGRNCHMSVSNAVALRRLNPVYLLPENGCITAETVEMCLSEYEDIAAVIITSPTYEGFISDIESISALCRKNGVTLIVDEAHGAHLPFAADAGFESFFGKSAIKGGADIVIQSLHKTLPALTQTAILHRNSDVVKRDALLAALDIYETSSPSYLLISSAEESIIYTDENKKELFDKYKNRLEKLYESPAADILEGYADVNGKTFRDPGKLVIKSEKLAMTGIEIYDILTTDCGLISEMCRDDYCLMMTSVCDGEECFERVESALIHLKEKAVGRKQPDFVPFSNIRIPAQALLPYEAMEMERELISTDKLSGKRRFIAAEPVIIYPPGIPVLMPGEYIDEEAAKIIKTSVESGRAVYGLYDGSISVLKTEAGGRRG